MYSNSLKNVHKFVAVSVFLSGCSALMYEITWQRVLVKLLGGTLPAVTLILAVFMGGLAIGSAVAARAGDRVRDPLKLFSWLELSLGAFGLFFPLLTTQASLGIAIGAVSSISVALFHTDPVIIYSNANGAMFINALLTCAAVALLMAPTIAMGATFPLCARAVEQLADFKHSDHDEPNSGTVADAKPSKSEPDFAVTEEISRLYMLNLCGAAFGAMTSAYVLLPWVGIADTIRASAAINLITSLILLLTHRYLLTTLSASAPSSDEPLASVPIKSVQTESAPSNIRIIIMCSVAGVFASMALALQVAWSRLFSLLFGSSTYSVAAVVAFSLLGLACGSALARLFLLRQAKFRELVSTSSAVASLLMTVSLFIFGQLPWWLPKLELSLAQAISPVAGYLLARCLLIMLVVLPQTAILGTITPFLLGRLVRQGQRTAWITGHLLFATTLGSIIGASVTGWFIIPLLVPLHIPPLSSVSGLQSTFVMIAIMQALIAIATVANVLRDTSGDETSSTAQDDVQSFRIRISAIAVASCLSLVFALNHPTWNPAAMSCGISALPIATVKMLPIKKLSNIILGVNNDLLFYREGSSSTVTVTASNDKNVIYLKNDGKVEAALPVDPKLPSPTSDETTQVLLGILPTLLCPVPPENEFLIGYGSGTTAGAILRDPQIKSLTIAELEPAVFRAGSLFAGVNNRPLRPKWVRSGRVIPVVADARNLLALTNRQYDIITSQPAEPWTTGSADLYSLEFWRLAKSRLKEHGVLAQWLQLYAIDSDHLALVLRTFTAVFPNTVLFHAPRSGELILIGFESEQDKVDPNTIFQRMKAFPDKNVLARIGIDTSQDLLNMLVGTRDSVQTFLVTRQSLTGDSRINTDNSLSTEYMIPTTIFSARDTIDKNLNALEVVTPKEVTALRAPEADLSANLYRKSCDDLKAGKSKEALEAAETSVKVSPDCGRCYEQLAACLLQLNRVSEADIAAKRSITIDPNRYSARMLYARCAIENNQTGEALKRLKEASDTDPSRLEPYIAVTSLYVSQGDWQSAKLNWVLLQKRAPDNRETLILGTIIHDGLGDSKTANELKSHLPDWSVKSIEELKSQKKARLKTLLRDAL